MLAKETKKKHHLDASTDALFSELRDLNFSSVGKTLNKHARRLDDDYKVGLEMASFSLLVDGFVTQSFFAEPSTGQNCTTTTGFRRQTEWVAERAPVIAYP